VGQYLSEGDGTTQNYQLSWGNGDSHRLSVVVGGNFVKQGPVSSADRAISAFPAPYATSCAAGGCSSFIPNGRFDILQNPSLPADLGCTDPDTCDPIVPATNPFLDLTLISAPTNTPTLANFRDFVSPNDRFNFAPFNYLQIPLKRYGAFANLNYELADNFHATLKGLYNKRKSVNQAAPLPFGIGVQAGITPVLDNTTIDVTNPFNPFGVTLDASNMAFILRRFVEGGPRHFEQTVDTTYVVGGFDGNFGFMNHDWYWDLNAVYGHNLAKQTMTGNINSAHLRQALGPVDECVGQPGQFGGTCVPFNFFGGAGSITPEMMNFVTFVQHDRSKQDMLDFTGNLSGELFDLPGGPLGLATGVEYRDQSGRFDPDPIVAAGFSSDIPAQPTKGGYNVKEAYAELNAPIFKGVTAIDLLELNGAVRYSKYNTDSGQTFSHTTFKASGNYKPIHDLRLRASWAQGFRAPSIGELFGTQSRFDQTISDPCSNDSTAAQNFNNNATVKNNCIAHGVPSNGSYAQANPQISVIVGGNENLEPETSKSLVFGAVFSPSFLPGFSVEANHYKIKIKGAIQPVDAEVTLNNCEVLNDPAACALVTRVNGALTQISGTLVNIAGINTKGTDLNIAYHSRKTRLGRFGVTWNNTFLHSFDQIIPITGGTQVISREGTEQGSPSQGFPKWKSIGVLDWDGAEFGASLTGRYISKLKEDVTPAHTMGAKFYTDLQLRYTPAGLNDHFGFAVGANNLFNTKAPGCITCDINNFDPTMYDIPGRYYYARATVKY
jgi:iron complex outermembrane receptor protein